MRDLFSFSVIIPVYKSYIGFFIPIISFQENMN